MRALIVVAVVSRALEIGLDMRSGCNTLSGLVLLSDTRPSQRGLNKGLLLVGPHLRRHGVSLTYVGSARWQCLIRDLLANARSLRRGGLDFVLFNARASITTPVGWLLLSLLARLRAKLVIYWRETYGQFEMAWRRWPGRMRVIRRVLGRARTVVHLANSHACKMAVSRVFPWLDPVVVWNCAWVPPGLNQPVEPWADPPIVLGSGALEYQKGPDLFVKVAAEVCKRHPTVEFWWLGDGGADDKWCDDIKEAGLGSRVVFLGFVPSPWAIMRRAAAFFMSSREESFSQATAEAMCLARTVVTFESGGPPEILGGHGLVVPGFDLPTAVDVFLDLLARPPASLVNWGARQRYLSLYTPEVHAERFAACLKSVL